MMDLAKASDHPERPQHGRQPTRVEKWPSHEHHVDPPHQRLVTAASARTGHAPLTDTGWKLGHAHTTPTSPPPWGHPAQAKDAVFPTIALIFLFGMFHMLYLSIGLATELYDENAPT